MTPAADVENGMSFQDYLRQIKGAIREVTVEEVLAMDREDIVMVDVRQRDEVAQGRVEGSLVIPRGGLEMSLPTAAPDLDKRLVLYCAGGTRSALAAHAAMSLGYTDVSSMAGGFGRWKTQGAPFAVLPIEGPKDIEAGCSVPPVAAVSPDDLAAAIGSPEAPVVFDLRDDEETGGGYIGEAILTPRGFFEMRVGQHVAAPDARVVLVSSRGVAAAYAARNLEAMGYTNVAILDGGMAAWRDGGHPVVVPRRLSAMDRLRYSRHLSVDEVGEAGQLKLLESRVLIMGAGGLGSPAAYYLAAAGVGKLGIVDSDVVDRSNLQRQILHTDARVGVPKVESARQTLLALNPDIDVVPYEVRLTSENVEEIFDGYDLVIDGGDNFPTRYLVNDACVHLGIPCVHGSVYRFEGQVTVFDPGAGGPCYRCLYPEPPPPELAPSCAEAGVLGVLPGIVGLLQANEAIKVLLGIGDTLVGRLLHVDGLSMKFRELRLRPDPDCPLCAEGAQWSGYIDYEQFCSFSAE
jgi:molybdopterin/thiamine biosynthesis adenylyltransferase/rhodanese-related sulfurtransferase